MMEKMEFQRKFADLLPNIHVKFTEPMSKHTSFRIGGPVLAMVFPKCEEELARTLEVSALLDQKCRILGAGTNILAPDEGLDEIVICLKDCMDGMIRLDDTRVQIAAGVTMSRAALFAANLGLGGMEFAHGIPGTVGGGVYMNAGAYGGELSQICESVRVMDFRGKITVYSGAEMGFSYRHSRLEEEPGIVLSAIFSLKKSDELTVKEIMQDFSNRRKASQPLNMPSAGSAFKRPVGGYAAALIDETGLKGYRVGDAAVSEKHAGFVVNLGNATAKDVLCVLNDVSDQVYSRTSIRLEPEVRVW